MRVLDQLSAEHVDMIIALFQGMLGEDDFKGVTQRARELGTLARNGTIARVTAPPPGSTPATVQSLEARLQSVEQRLTNVSGRLTGATAQTSEEIQKLREIVMDLKELTAISNDETYGMY